jgi:hypothetical protein
MIHRAGAAQSTPLQPHRANYPVPVAFALVAHAARCVAWAGRTLASSNERVGGGLAVPCHVNRPAYTSSYKGPIKIGVWPIEARRNRIHAIRLCHVTRRDDLPPRISLSPSASFVHAISPRNLLDFAPIPSACALSSRPQCVSLDCALLRFW